MTREEAIICMVRDLEAGYRVDIRRTPHAITNPDYSHAVHKASMCAVIAARIERGDHLVGRDVEAPTHGYQAAADRDE